MNKFKNTKKLDNRTRNGKPIRPGDENTPIPHFHFYLGR